MNAENFEKWMSSQVLPNLPPSSVVVMDNTPYHGKQVDKVPSKYSVKADMIGWLERRGVAASSSMRKSTLIELINAHKPAEKLFSVNVLLKNHGHTVPRLPPYMCELNVIELAWAKVKHLIRENNTAS
jgi:transposase